MLAGTCLSNDTRLTHFLRQQDLSDGVVNLMGTRVIQVLTLQIQLTTVLLAHPFRIIERWRTSHIVLQQRVVLLLELFTLNNRQIGFLQVVYTLVEYLWHVSTAELSVKSFLVNLIIAHIFGRFCVSILLYDVLKNLRGPSQERQASLYLLSMKLQVRGYLLTIFRILSFATTKRSAC